MTASPSAPASPVRRLLVLLALGVVPWTVVLVAGEATLVFPFGLVNTAPLHLTTLPDFLTFTGGGVPTFLQSWVVGAVLYCCALASAAVGTVWREDPRLTGGLLALAAVTQFPLVLGFAQRLGYTALPVGTLLLLLAAWWLYWPAVRGYKTISDSPE
ncbi:TIGR04206 family protein [Halomarina ordinaria]|uniref:TIGR04206 family protein n=1 Tax=Halomarina ordinaria TaxID=3033939 RepID=A0ABD5U670_9EURY|nr:TIGR04206 family protein [Halomarina sp. PSRA2]